MLTIKTFLVGSADGIAKMWRYEHLSEADTAPPEIQIADFPDVSVQIVGDFGGGSTTFQCSNDGINWVTALDHGGNDISLSASGLRKLGTPARFVRPLAGGSGTDVDVIIFARKPRP